MYEPSRLSYSSLSTYAECGQRWLLERGYKRGGGTWYATLAGSALHRITELLDLQLIGLYDGEIPTFQEEFDREITKALGEGQEIKASGRVLKAIGKTGGPNKKDYDWWLQFGPERIDAWVTWRDASKLRLLEIDVNGKLVPAIEIKVTFVIDGDPQVGFIDRVYVDKEGEVVVVDLKNGNDPTSNLQLGTYRYGLLKDYGIDATWGGYWMSSSGEIPALINLSQYSNVFIESLFNQAWRGIRAGVFLPNVTNMCRGCGVKDFCRAVGGKNAAIIPVETVVVRRDN